MSVYWHMGRFALQERIYNMRSSRKGLHFSDCKIFSEDSALKLFHNRPHSALLKYAVHKLDQESKQINI